jgi:hypothetical protein
VVRRLFGALPSSGSCLEIKVFPSPAVTFRTPVSGPVVADTIAAVTQRLCREPESSVPRSAIPRLAVPKDALDAPRHS